jgi:hypothetical protein
MTGSTKSFFIESSQILMAQITSLSLVIGQTLPEPVFIAPTYDDNISFSLPRLS